MSDRERPELAAFRELQQLIGHLGEELAGFRRRALQAEARLRTLEEGGGAEAAADRLGHLEHENTELRRRLEAATTRTRQVLDRVRFLRQQRGQEA